tara:strand:- start:27 stop:449 length:423 start_codon:yes stop_codon:yes gene_type:complete
MSKPQQLEFDFEPKKPKQKTVIQQYEVAIDCANKHIKQLEERLDQKDNLIDRILEYYIDSSHPEDERTATRRIYKLIYQDEWKNYIDGKFLTKEEGDEWFNDNHDRYLCSGDHIANMSYLDLMEWNLAEIKQREGGTHAN